MKYKQLIAVFLFVIGMLCVDNTISAQTQLTPECYVTKGSDSYLIHFTLPGYTIEDVAGGPNDGCGTFSRIVMDDGVDHDGTDEPGYPELPFFSLNLLLPFCTSGLHVDLQSSVIDQEYLSYYINPASKGSVEIEPGIYVEMDEDCYNEDYYTYGYTSDYPYGFHQDFYSYSNIYTAFGAKGITLSIFPFSYHPEAGYMTVLQEAVFEINFDCGNLFTTMSDIQEASGLEALATQLFFDTFNDTEIVNNSEDNGNYLIVAAHRNMETSLTRYVQYKQAQNYNTEVIYLDDYNNVIGDEDEIYALIYNNNEMPNPDFVLLVGDLSDIPPCDGYNDPDNPYTDDCYHSFLGRWVVSEEQNLSGEYIDLENIIDKTIQTETGYVNSYSTASLFSGIDSNIGISLQFYIPLFQIAQNSFYQMGIPYTLYNGSNYSQPTAETYMKNSIINNTRFFIYNGHGNDATIGSPYKLYSWNISTIRNSSPTPMGFGFACHLNSYSTNNNFGAEWVSSGSGGGAAFYGATTVSYCTSNGYLAMRMFEVLKEITAQVDNFPLSLWLRLSELTYSVGDNIPMRKKQVNKYNLMGDPTLAVYGMDTYGTYAPYHMPKKEVVDAPSDSKIRSIEIYDISGKKMTVSNRHDISSLPLSAGVYVIKTLYNDGTFSTNKIIK